MIVDLSLPFLKLSEETTKGKALVVAAETNKTVILDIKLIQ